MDITKANMQIISETISQMTEENNGELLLLPNLDNIAKRAEVSMDTIVEYFRIRLLGEDIAYNKDDN